MEVFKADVAIVGAGGTGLRAAIAVAEADPSLKVALVSKVYPMRSHTVAAEGGAAGVVRDDDNLEYHFNDTVGGGDWLCDQNVVEYFVAHCTEELIQLDHWGCPWSRKPDGHINVRAFGGMKIERRRRVRLQAGPCIPGHDCCPSRRRRSRRYATPASHPVLPLASCSDGFPLAPTLGWAFP